MALRINHREGVYTGHPHCTGCGSAQNVQHRHADGYFCSIACAKRWGKATGTRIECEAGVNPFALREDPYCPRECAVPFHVHRSGRLGQMGGAS